MKNQIKTLTLLCVAVVAFLLGSATSSVTAQSTPASQFAPLPGSGWIHGPSVAPRLREQAWALRAEAYNLKDLNFSAYVYYTACGDQQLRIADQLEAGNLP